MEFKLSGWNLSFWVGIYSCWLKFDVVVEFKLFGGDLIKVCRFNYHNSTNDNYNDNEPQHSGGWVVASRFSVQAFLLCVWDAGILNSSERLRPATIPVANHDVGNRRMTLMLRRPQHHSRKCSSSSPKTSLQHLQRTSCFYMPIGPYAESHAKISLSPTRDLNSMNIES